MKTEKIPEIVANPYSIRLYGKRVSEKTAQPVAA
jgi:hypothetical protein